MDFSNDFSHKYILTACMPMMASLVVFTRWSVCFTMPRLIPNSFFMIMPWSGPVASRTAMPIKDDHPIRRYRTAM
jgi:hypothetical protein